MGNKLILIGVAIMAIGLIALPQTLALFAGQHNFYNTGGGSSLSNGNQIPCEKCHADIAIELDQGGYTNNAHKAQGCEGCHITAPQDKGVTFGGPIDRDAHAAASPACLDCHDGSGAGDARSIFSSSEAHSPFANESAKSSNLLLKDANEACISCHTHVAVHINWTKAYAIYFEAEESVLPDSTHTWILGNFATEGSAVIQSYGNQTGGFTNQSGPVISVSTGFDPNNP